MHEEVGHMDEEDEHHEDGEVHEDEHHEDGEVHEEGHVE
jgi:hypothetical protein